MDNILTPIKFVERRNHKPMWLYKCECGNYKIIRKDAVDCGYTKSCGCLQIKFARSGNARRSHGMSNSRFWGIWAGIKRRTSEKKRTDYNRYGGRGIGMCKRWRRFENFMEDMYKNYNKHCEEYGIKNTTIERIDNNLGYSKKNCRWATWGEQANNKRTNVFIKYNNERLTHTQWERRLGLPPKYFSRKVKCGVDVQAIISGLIN